MGVLVRKVTLSDEKILDSWSVLIEDANGRVEEFYDSVLKFVEEERMPNVRAEMVKAFPHSTAKIFSKFSKSLRALGRDYLMVSNDYLDRYRMFIGAKDYGKNLNVSWYLVCEPYLLDKLFKKASRKNRLYANLFV